MKITQVTFTSSVNLFGEKELIMLPRNDTEPSVSFSEKDTGLLVRVERRGGASKAIRDSVKLCLVPWAKIKQIDYDPVEASEKPEKPSK